MAECFRIAGELLLLDIKAVPGSSKSQIAGLSEGRLRIKIAASPEDGKANTELRAFLAKLLGCPRKDITLVAGEKSRLKTAALPLGVKEKLDEIVKEVRK
ncbi:protein C15orf40 [Treponema primitia ZAS-2]|uniref:UPF0235 protein TREPR_2235 n=1 Tax=Treponema primitia (strain ATCC BAA-887 / DSM 12427 / ZAS-2) TaxID=545694 RepID=F5YIG8_TREPZ|nr:DUF167 domain-containing protein [Treponema primitia]AEF85057.1 protein C15orf40 [Treponema primitia ZAS-2]